MSRIKDEILHFRNSHRSIVGFTISRMIHETIPNSYVRVVVTDKSGHVVNTLQLMHENGSMKVHNIINGASFKLLFYAEGEDSYNLTATFEDKTIVSTAGEYVEPGYHIEETIYRDTI